MRRPGRTRQDTQSSRAAERLSREELERPYAEAPGEVYFARCRHARENWNTALPTGFDDFGIGTGGDDKVGPSSDGLGNLCLF